MISADQLELRILTGLHRGARAPVMDAAWIGSDADCDIVLSDPGLPTRAGRIRIAARSWRIDTEPAYGSAASPPTSSVALGAALRVGPVWISVAPLAAPWPDPAALADGVLPAPAGARNGAGAAARRQKPYKRAAAWAMMAGAAVVLAAGTRMFWTNGTANATPASPYKMELDRAARQAAAALDALALASDAQVHQDDDDPVTVTGWVRNDVEYEQLAEALARIQPRPAIKVEIATVQIRAAQGVLKDFLLRSHVQYLGSGRLTIQGIAASAERRTAAIQTLEAKLAGVTVETHDIVLLSDVTASLKRGMNAILLPNLSVRWANDGLEIDTERLDTHQLLALSPLVAQFNKNNLNSVHPVPEPPPAPPPAASIPFRITSVVGGTHPWLLLECGTKLMVGGTYANYRLESIAKDKIVFKGPDAVVTIQR
ncbi:type III secretion system inner membrane ring subunit SctD [Achromobacter aloeverae]|uniref:EscD/YscD/HrpQ family type III secretion system inner membrane ring protein n=1 Tax=Achromobacter aloeverae TaxID=1750518 RepID=A0A4Q1HHT2_9BURK|nr:type III secretion system inner membrane ring subunit SctD [Achromobacter aloeverae]RXN87772.1 EscD/YscD/HrpQ family type III secretion system inner membrane ring protein [Achromobacter aloeverae]